MVMVHTMYLLKKSAYLLSNLACPSYILEGGMTKQYCGHNTGKMALAYSYLSLQEAKY